jgi:hypothetical protein
MALHVVNRTTNKKIFGKNALVYFAAASVTCKKKGFNMDLYS